MKAAIIMRMLAFSVLLILLLGCGSLPPGVSLKNAHFAEEPIIIHRDGHFYLRYRRALEREGLTLANLLLVKKTADAGYYYFSRPISHPEWGNLVERPLAYDGLEHHARAGRVFWLDPDGTQHPIPVRQEP